MLRILLLIVTCLSLGAGQVAAAEDRSVKVLAFYSMDVEPDHRSFAWAAIVYFTELSHTHHFDFEYTTDWARHTDADLAKVDLVVWLNNSPRDPDQRAAFERYMTGGGAWMGFHVSAYNDKDTHWPWFVAFLGGAVFHSNNWPPLPAKMTVDAKDHPVTRRLPTTFLAPTNEWYQWQPSPRDSPKVKVLVTLDPANYPLGKKDLLTGGDTPVVWTNTKYRMLYMNIGHIDKSIDSDEQRAMVEDAVQWLGRKR